MGILLEQRSGFRRLLIQNLRMPQIVSTASGCRHGKKSGLSFPKVVLALHIGKLENLLEYDG